MKTKNMNKIIVILMLLISALGYGQVDPTIIWQNTIGGLGREEPEGILSCLDGGYIIGGNSNSNISGDITENSYGDYDIQIIKTDSIGNIIWQKKIGGDTTDKLIDMISTSDGGYLLGAISTSGISGNITELGYGLEDYWVIKINALGNIEWQKKYGGMLNDNISQIIQSHDNNFFLFGSSESNISGNKTDTCRGGLDFWVLKIDIAGNIIWQKTIGGNLNDGFDYNYHNSQATWLNEQMSLVENIDNTITLYGRSMSDSSGDRTLHNTPGFYGNGWIVKLDSVGNKILEKIIDWNGFNYHDISFIRYNNGYLLTTNIPSNGNSICMLDSNYNIIWEKFIRNTTWLNPLYMSVNITSENKILVLTISNLFPRSPGGDLNEAGDINLILLDDNSNIIWQNSFKGMYLGKSCLNSKNELSIVCVNSLFSPLNDVTEASNGDYDFWLAKIKTPKHIVSGKVFADINIDCLFDSIIDVGVKNIILNNIYTRENLSTYNKGDYNFFTNTDTLGISLAYLPFHLNSFCISSDSIYIYFDSTSSFDSTNVNFPIIGDSCWNTKIDINQSIINIPCFYSTFNIDYNNLGFDTARTSFIIVEVDTSILDSFSSITPFILSGDTIRFDIGDVAPFEYNTISFTAYVKCSSTIGTSTCTRAYIYPLSNCPPPIVGYDSSDIEVLTRCSNDTVHVEVKNRVGAQDMTSPGRIIAIEDEIIQLAEPFILNAGLSVNYDYYVNPDRTLTIKVEQNPKHPQRPVIILHDELCALNAPIKLNSVISNFSRYDDADEYEEVCTRIIGSYDPNIKSVVPQGFTSQHYTDSNQVLEYRIDFQNTGLDTARRVVILDTLSPWLDISTFVPLVASHTYRTQLEGINIIHFIFDPILLPDSIASEPNSHGYVTFKIRPKFNTPKGTVINNFADIFFDYNAPVRTNTVFNTIYDTVLVKIGVGLNESKENLEAHVLVFPNPTIDKFFVKLDNDIQGAQIKLLDINGREVYQMNNVNGREIEMKANNLTQGIYFINIYDKNKLIGRSKIIVQ